MIPVHVKDFELNSDHLGDRRGLPMLKLVLARARKLAEPSDFIVLTNSDNLLHARLPDLLHTLTIPAACSFRLNSRGPVALNLPPETLAARLKPDYGRDLFVFTGTWLDEHWNSIPDMFLGEWEWDLILTLLIRNSLGIVTKTTHDFHTLTKGELPLGYVLHEAHNAAWKNPSNLSAPAKEWNKAIAHAWYEDNGLLNLFTLGE
jgi:hypothetical protein